MKNVFKVALGLLLITTSPQALAQTIPSSTDAGIVIRDIAPVEREMATMGNIINFDDSDKARDSLSDEKLFTLNRVELKGSSVYSQKQINAAAKNFLGKETSFRDLHDLNQAMTRKYREDGYIFSRTELSPQKIKDGVVVLNVLEGRIENVEVVGQYKDPTNLVQKLAAKIKSSGAANTNTIERYLLLINDIPGITARSVLRPSESQGAGDLLITVTQEQVEGSLTIDNRGSEYLGQGRATIVGAVNGLLTVDDRTTLRGIISSDREELKFADLTHERQIGTEGLQVKLRHATTATEPGKELKILPVEGESKLADLELAYPFLRSRNLNINFYGGLNVLNSETDVATFTVARDKVRALRFGVRGNNADSFNGTNEFDLAAFKGVDWLGATEEGIGRSKINGDQEFSKFTLEASRIQGLFGNYSLLVSAAGQYSGDALLSSEEFSIGGGTYGRAYDSGEITGDKGASASVEVRYGQAVDKEFMESYEAFLFYDIGKVWNKDVQVGEQKSESIASAGLGTRFNLPYQMSASIELAKPLTSTVEAEGDDDNRVFFSLTKRF